MRIEMKETADILKHILIICDIYETSTNKVERIIQYSKSKLNEIEKIKRKEKTKDAKCKRCASND
jgi:hypothetical protein